MAKSNLINMLNRKYAELLGQLHYCKPPLNDVTDDLDHLAATIRLFAPDWTDEGIKPIKLYRPNRWLKRGEGIKMALSVLRDATEPLTTRQISIMALAKQNILEPDALTVKLCVASFNNTLSRRIGRSVMMVDGKPKRWLIMPRASDLPIIKQGANSYAGGNWRNEVS